jgi:virginiamycin B lyase
VHEIALPDHLTAGGSTHELAVGPQGNVWITQQNQSALVRVTPAGEVRVFPLRPGLGPHGIGFDARGRMWITLQFADQIAQVNSDGEITRTYTIPLADAQPHGLTVARNGNVWWTGKMGDAIGELDPGAGTIRLFPIRQLDSQPIYIKQGCGDDMYFTELNASAIGQLDPRTGVITQYRTPTRPRTTGSRPIAIATRGCQVWFTEERGGHYGVLDPATGAIKEYATGYPADMLASLAFDRDDRLWLEFNGPQGHDALGLVSENMQTVARMIAIPSRDAVLHRIILGPGGDMWFTELNTDKVGWITP